MPVDKLILEKLSDDLDTLEGQLQSIATNLEQGLRNKLSDSVTEARNLVDAFTEGKDITKKLEAQMTKLQKESNRLTLQSIKLQNDLTQAIASGNRQLIIKAQLAKAENDLAIQAIESNQTVLNKLQQQVDAQKEANKQAFELLKSTFSLEKIMSSGIVKAVLAVNTQVTNLGRSLGVSYESAKELRDGMESFAKSANDGFTTVARLAKAQSDLTDQLGIAVDFGNEERQQFAQLTELVGLTADEAGKLASLSASTGMSTDAYLKDVRAAGFAAQQTNKIHISDKQLLQSISTLSAGILVKFKNNPKALAEAVIQAKKFGLTLEQINKTGDSLLEWESSIENELKAELITGKQLNLERARAAALTGDQATLMQEVASQAGTLEEFSNMNVIAQRSLAEAFGMSSDEMAEMLMKQEAINKYGSAAEELNAQQLKDFEKSGMSLDAYLEKQDKQVDIQTKFNTAVERLQEIFGNLAAGPLGTILGIFADLLSNSTSLAAILGGVMMVNLAKMVVTMKRLAKVSKSGAISDIISAAFKSVGGIPGIGAIAAVTAAAAGLAYFSSKTQDVEDGTAPPGRGPFTITDKFGATAVTAAGDGIAVSPNISNNEGISASNANNGGGDNAGLMAAINELRNAVNALANKPAPAMAIQVGAEKLGEVVGKQAETGTNQYKNAYRLA
jgi:hypothetical protein